MDRVLKRFLRKRANRLGSGEKAIVQSTETIPDPLPRPFRPARESGWCPTELLIIIARLTDSRTLVAFALSSRWLFHEISNWSKFWEEQFCQEFQFKRDDTELYWLQQFVERQRSFNLTVTSEDKTSHRHRRRRVKKEKAEVEMNWFRAYCCRQQTQINLSRSVPFSERTIPLPSEYHQTEFWQLMVVNPRYQVYVSSDHRSLITYRPDNSF